jgi:RNA polymerase sigma-70 factor (ECF subfamily)
MADGSINTVLMNDLVLRAQLGDNTARDDLVRRVLHRLERMSQRMLRKFPNVARHLEWEDILSVATTNLLRTLETRNPSSTREFFNLAAAIIRNHLIDLARRFKRRNELQVPAIVQGESSTAIDLLDSQPSAESTLDEDLDLWTEFHKAVETLDPDEREIFSLIVYHDWPYEEIATLFNCSTKTVQRRYNAAVVALREKLGEDLLRLLR